MFRISNTPAQSSTDLNKTRPNITSQKPVPRPKPCRNTYPAAHVQHSQTNKDGGHTSVYETDKQSEMALDEGYGGSGYLTEDKEESTGSEYVDVVDYDDLSTTVPDNPVYEGLQLPTPNQKTSESTSKWNTFHRIKGTTVSVATQELFSIRVTTFKMSLFFLAFLILIVVSGCIGYNLSRSREYQFTQTTVEVEDNTFTLYKNLTLKRKEAQRFCKKNGQSLPVILDMATDLKLMNLMDKNGISRVWTNGWCFGFRPACEWKRNKISFMKYTHWAPDFPSPTFGHYCLASTGQGWENRDCSLELDVVCQQ